ncbi:hypothetical protein DOY81_002319, partial [Sarcophaga bullata]
WPLPVVFGQDLVDDVKNVAITNGNVVESALPNNDSSEKRIKRTVFYPPPFFGGFGGRRFGGFYGRRRFYRRRRFGDFIKAINFKMIRLKLIRGY